MSKICPEYEEEPLKESSYPSIAEIQSLVKNCNNPTEKALATLSFQSGACFSSKNTEGAKQP
jgi:hypothetical protein